MLTGWAQTFNKTVMETCAINLLFYWLIPSDLEVFELDWEVEVSLPLHLPRRTDPSSGDENSMSAPSCCTDIHPALKKRLQHKLPAEKQTSSWLPPPACQQVLAAEWHYDKTFSALSIRMQKLCTAVLHARSLSGHLFPCWVHPVSDAKSSHTKLMRASCKSFYLSSCFLFWHLSVIRDYLWFGAWTVCSESFAAHPVNDLQI